MSQASRARWSSAISVQLLILHVSAIFAGYTIHVLGYKYTFAIASAAAGLRMGPLLLLTGLVRVSSIVGRGHVWREHVGRRGLSREREGKEFLLSASDHGTGCGQLQ